jgi:hypothetical protein
VPVAVPWGSPFYGRGGRPDSKAARCAVLSLGRGTFQHGVEGRGATTTRVNMSKSSRSPGRTQVWLTTAMVRFRVGAPGASMGPCGLCDRTGPQKS